MGISYSKYKLEPIEPLNRFNPSIREGCFFCLDNKFYLDYCPWEQFGDLSVDRMLSLIKSSNDIPKLFYKLFNIDEQVWRIDFKSFFNHDFKGGEYSKYLKVKGDENIDLKETIYSHPKQLLRIDFNNSLNKDLFIKMISSIDNSDLTRIDYVEDPFEITDNINSWEAISKLGVDLASDRNPDSPFSKYRIYKPGIDLVFESVYDNPVIFSSYMGSELNLIHTYVELILHGDLSLRHGLITPNAFKDQLDIFHNINQDRYVLKRKLLDKYYDSLKEREWKRLI